MADCDMFNCKIYKNACAVKYPCVSDLVKVGSGGYFLCCWHPGIVACIRVILIRMSRKKIEREKVERCKTTLENGHRKRKEISCQMMFWTTFWHTPFYLISDVNDVVRTIFKEFLNEA